MYLKDFNSKNLVSYTIADDTIKAITSNYDFQDVAVGPSSNTLLFTAYITGCDLLIGYVNFSTNSPTVSNINAGS
jgi:hypothetical protein